MFSVLFYIFILAFTLAMFVLMCVAFVLTAPFDRSRRVIHWLAKVWTGVFFGLLPGGRKVYGRGNVEKGKPCVIVVNHASMLDIPLMYFLPGNFKWVSKREVYKWPLFGWVLRMQNDITIERGTAGAVKKMVKDGGRWLSKGVPVVVFPEGSRSRDGEIRRFREGAFMLARSAGVGVLPCVSVGTDTAFRGWRLDTANRYCVRVLPPVSAEDVAGTPLKELAERVREDMVAAREELKKM